MDNNHSKRICFDFDGVIHSYTSGWTEIDHVADDPVPEALNTLISLTSTWGYHDWVYDLPVEERDQIMTGYPNPFYVYTKYEVSIFSSRSADPKGIEAMQIWLLHHLWNHLGDQNEARDIVYKKIKWPTTKPAAFLTIDDRAITFSGIFPHMEEIDNFKPWNKL